MPQLYIWHYDSVAMLAQVNPKLARSGWGLGALMHVDASQALLPASTQRAEQIDLGLGNLCIGLGEVGFGSGQSSLGVQHRQ